MTKHENDQQSRIEDLPVAGAQEAETRGGIGARPHVKVVDGTRLG